MTRIIRNVIGIWSFLLLSALCMTGCSADENPVPGVADGEPVTLSFALFKAPSTRADDTATRTDTLINNGATIRVYVYKVGETNLSAPLATGLYTVDNSTGTGVATGDLALFRGTYDLYLVSYNSTTETPVLASGGKISVSNGKDFMYTTMKGVVVQPERAGVNTIQVELSQPFTRMGARVIVKVAAKNGAQPVQPSTLVANSIEVKGLPASLDYNLGGTAWNAASGYNSSYTYRKFKRATNSVNDWWKSEPEVLLAVDGSKKLDFIVNLAITYDSGTQTYTDPFKASVQKVLLPGMTYEFQFSLTFYGILTPTDLTLAVREYNTVELSSDGLGKG